MAQSFLTPIDLNTLELLNFRVQNLSTGSQPAGALGQMYFNTTNNELRYYDGAWKTIGTSGGSVTSVAATAPAAGFTISGSPITTSGTFTFSLADDLAAVEGISTTGITARTASNTWTTRTITGTSNEISLSNGDGISGNPTISLPSALTFTGKTVTGGTFTTPTINVNDDVFSIRDNGDTSKVLQFQLSGITASTTRTLTIPDASGTIALTSNLSGYQTLDTGLTNLAAFNTNGILVQTSNDNFAGRQIAGTASRITVTNGDGVSGNPTIDIHTSYVGQSSITTLGTIGTGVWQGTAITPTYGGTGTNNGSFTIGIGGNVTIAKGFTISNANDVTFTTTGATSVTLPTSGTLATTTDVTNAIQGVKWKNSVRLATTAAGTLATSFENGDTLDGRTLVTGDRILIKDQASATENGIYTVNASGAPTRATDADTGSELEQMVVFVQEGNVNADRGFVCTTDLPITLGSSNITYSDFASASVPDATDTIKGKVELATKTETDAKSDTVRAVTPAGLADFARRYITQLTGSATSYTVTHNLNNQWCHVQIYKTASPYNLVQCDIELASATTCTVKFAVAPSSNEYTAVCIG